MTGSWLVNGSFLAGSRFNRRERVPWGEFSAREPSESGGRSREDVPGRHGEYSPGASRAAVDPGAAPGRDARIEPARGKYFAGRMSLQTEIMPPLITW
jgi:hypothetical protein